MSQTFRWDELLAEVSKKVPPQQFRAWIEPIKFLELTDKCLVVGAPTTFSRDWVSDHYRPTFRSALLELYGLHLDLRVEVRADENHEMSLDSSAMLTMPPMMETGERLAEPSHQREQGASEPEPRPFDFGRTPRDGQQQSFVLNTREDRSADSFYSGGADTSHRQEGDVQPAVSSAPMGSFAAAPPVVRTLGQPLDPKQTFDTFVVGASNQFAHAAARAVAEHPATQYNPLFLYSDAGLGKTHLLHAIGNYVLRANPKAKICYISAEKFVNDLIDSIHHGKMSQFREKYRDSYDILLMDDIQFIAGKDRTQEEFFHTFNALHSSRRQIVVTSDKFPKDIPGLEDRIRTRFEWGLVADIQPPEIETRIAILRAKAEIDDIFLPNDVALFMASNIKSNIRELEGCLIRLGAQASLTGSEISIDLAKQVLRNVLKEPSASITADAIFDAVARHFSIKVSDIKGKERSRRVALPRQIAMYLIRKYCEKSYPDIGLLLGGKDHSTILHGVKTIEAQMEKDPEIRKHVEEIQNSF